MDDEDERTRQIALLHDALTSAGKPPRVDKELGDQEVKNLELPWLTTSKLGGAGLGKVEDLVTRKEEDVKAIFGHNTHAFLQVKSNVLKRGAIFGMRPSKLSESENTLPPNIIERPEESKYDIEVRFSNRESSIRFADLVRFLMAAGEESPHFERPPVRIDSGTKYYYRVCLSATARSKLAEPDSIRIIANTNWSLGPSRPMRR